MDYLAEKCAKEIAEKTQALRCAFRNKLDERCEDFIEAFNAENGNEYNAADRLAHDEKFIKNELEEEVIDLAMAILNSDVCGLYLAGLVPVARTREEWQAKSAKQTSDFFHDVNKTLRSFEAFMDEHKNGII